MFDRLNTEGTPIMAKSTTFFTVQPYASYLLHPLLPLLPHQLSLLPPFQQLSQSQPLPSYQLLYASHKHPSIFHIIFH